MHFSLSLSRGIWSKNMKKAERNERHKLEKHQKNGGKKKKKEEKKYEYKEMIIKMTKGNDSLLVEQNLV
jgi:hypothetical protein